MRGKMGMISNDCKEYILPRAPIEPTLAAMIYSVADERADDAIDDHRVDSESWRHRVGGFIRDHAPLRAPPLCPEISLHLADDMAGAWAGTWAAAEAALAAARVPPPFWSVAWVGGQALARYLLDHPDRVAGRSLVDVGSGSGLVAIAAALAGAGRVTASDLDPLARVAIAMNAAANDATVEIDPVDPLTTTAVEADIVVAGDLWYERQIAEKVTPWLRRQAAAGRTVLVGDKRRAFFPRGGLEPLADYAVPTSQDLESEPLTTAGVWRLKPSV